MLDWHAQDFLQMNSSMSHRISNTLIYVKKDNDNVCLCVTSRESFDVIQNTFNTDVKARHPKRHSKHF